MSDLFIWNLGGDEADEVRSRREAERLRLHARYAQHLVRTVGIDEATAERVIVTLFNPMNREGRRCVCSSMTTDSTAHVLGTRRVERRKGELGTSFGKVRRARDCASSTRRKKRRSQLGCPGNQTWKPSEHRRLPPSSGRDPSTDTPSTSASAVAGGESNWISSPPETLPNGWRKSERTGSWSPSPYR